MTRRLRESLSGVGDVYAGDVLLRQTPYVPSLWADDHPQGTGGDDAPAIDGHIDITGIGEAVVLASPDSLTLKLEDGRRLAIRLTSTGGGIVGCGWLP